MRRQIHRETLAERRDANAGQYLIRCVQGKRRRREQLKVHRILQEQGAGPKGHHRLQQHQQEQKNQIDTNFVKNVFKGSNNFKKLYSSILINNKTNVIPSILNSLVKEIISDKDIISLQ